MNLDNLHTLIDRYEDNLAVTMGSVSHEQFKWEAVRIFRTAWFAPNAMEQPFSVLFNQARKGCGLLIDNSRMSATGGVVKMAEQEPSAVQELFLDLQSVSTDPDLRVRRDHIVDFGDKMELLRRKLFPRNWKYKHTFHDVSCYLSFFAPEQNYIYRATDAKLMAKYIGFEKPLGSGWYIDLNTYYEMCDIIVAALKEHPSLLQKHRSLLDDKCYMDNSLHLMAFDLMYCCQCYRYYHGLNYAVPVTNSSRSACAKASKAKQLLEEKRMQIVQRLDELNDQLLEAESQLSGIELISLENTTVTTKNYGAGIVVKHEGNNRITIRFADTEKTFAIHRNIPMRPTFEDDKDIVDLLSDREDLSKKIESINKQISYERARLQQL